MKKVSVIVPCYNMEKYLDNCFKSLINQTYKNLEIIFINDGSSDKTLNLLSKWEGEERLNFTLINQENKGISVTRNVGLRKATGDYIYFLDPDDIIFPTLIEELVNMLEDDKYDYSYCKFTRIRDGKKYEDIKFKNKKGKFTILNKTETLKGFWSITCDGAFGINYLKQILSKITISFFKKIVDMAKIHISALNILST